MKVVGSTCTLKNTEDMVRCLSEQSMAISKCKMEILQHVIDYIWDLQVELDAPGKQQAADVPRTPLTTLNAEIASISVENGCSDDRILCR
uniref:DNA-binding protein inhibitor ID-1 n=1 Tax=Salmo salar TaxID=8030 RepID=B5XC34_SALSA|nr:DNA-binding protein inhibitor ID-1 [Salmo salar]